VARRPGFAKGFERIQIKGFGGGRRNMVKSMAGFSENPAKLFAMFFYLGITILSNIVAKLSFSE
jgi:hypothetical protein